MVWACDKLDQFLRGTEFVLETDHKPLGRPMNTKNLHQIPARVLRMKLRLMRYGPEVRYAPGSQNHLADALSRMHSPGYELRILRYRTANLWRRLRRQFGQDWQSVTHW